MSINRLYNKGLYRETIINLLIINTIPRTLKFITSPNGPVLCSLKLCPFRQKKIMPKGAKMFCSAGQLFYIGIFMENNKKYSCLKPSSAEPWYLVRSIIKQTTTKYMYVQIMPLGSKTALLRDTVATCLTKAYVGKTLKIFQKPQCLESWYLVWCIT